MSLVVATWWIACAGAIGGIINALISDNGFVLPRGEKVDSTTILRPGVLGNILIGSVAAVLSWALYGPVAAREVTNRDPVSGFTLSAFAGAILVGIAGARWITNEVDKKLLRATAATAATVVPTGLNKVALAQLRSVSPAKALEMVTKLATELVVEAKGTADITLSLNGEVLAITNGVARKPVNSGEYILAWLVQGRGKSYSIKVTNPAYVTCQDSMESTPDEFVNGACPVRIV